ncbi:MAG: bifunctional DNA-formamidopyrimidine glycosylase/DNA-(apurinic or apyrimidinic site) lyase, partial [Proteobacteria bacterium]|nr:bifunctional DNA-formamidopyrimidine glycosylase/DNA-(apurinic or apyrimidinic site) lyase [Pseudomonadota bacterium]
MPELPEVETTVQGIKPWLENQFIDKISIYNPNLRWPIPDEILLCQGKKITEVFRRAKYILIKLADEQHLIMHLGMSGSISITQDDSPRKKHDHVEFVLSSGAKLRFNDPRRFGCVLLADQNYAAHKLMAKLGPEPLDKSFDGIWLKQQAKNRTPAIKNFIMNNHVVVGVGNIYASEALFLAGIRPDKKVNTITLPAFKKLAATIKQVLSEAIKQGGTTLSDFYQVDGKPGYFAQLLNVYDRKGQ